MSDMIFFKCVQHLHVIWCGVVWCVRVRVSVCVGGYALMESFFICYEFLDDPAYFKEVELKYMQVIDKEVEKIEAFFKCKHSSHFCHLVSDCL